MTRTTARLAGAALALLASGHGLAESGALVAGWAHACRITPDEGVECWGNNSGGTLPTQTDAGRTDTFIFDGIFRAQFE